jgi:hypothetical protein
MSRRTLQALKFSTWVLLLPVWAGVLLAQSRPVDPGLTAHEWGTFTSIAGSNGQAVEWTPLNGLSFNELPSFVERLHSGLFKLGLPGTIRMETPVLYFYSGRETTVSVQVKFAKGMITEWYPRATAPVPNSGLNDAAAYRKHAILESAISWNGVTLEPGTAPSFPHDAGESDIHYYAARETSSVPLTVQGTEGKQHEKFLFYRGVSEFSVPISAQFTTQGSLVVKNSMEEGISNVIWFERRGERVGYSTSNAVDAGGEAVLEPPALTSRIESLWGDLEEILVARGLYRDEAHAMIQTWRKSWFEEGSRLFYIVPSSFVDTILPLTITPAPAQTVRVFVGRLELISPATQKAVRAALAAKDDATLAKYGRFLEPILKMIHEQKPASSPPTGAAAFVPCLADPPQNAKVQH